MIVSQLRVLTSASATLRMTNPALTNSSTVLLARIAHASSNPFVGRASPIAIASMLRPARLNANSRPMAACAICIPKTIVSLRLLKKKEKKDKKEKKEKKEKKK